MADGIPQRDIILKVITSYERKAMTRAFSDIDKLEARITSLRERGLLLPVNVAQLGNARKLLESLDEGSVVIGDRWKKNRQAIDDYVQSIRKSGRVTKEVTELTPSGKLIKKQTIESDKGVFKLEDDLANNRVKVTKDIKKAREELLSVQDQEQQKAIQTEKMWTENEKSRERASEKAIKAQSKTLSKQDLLVESEKKRKASWENAQRAAEAQRKTDADAVGESLKRSREQEAGLNRIEQARKTADAAETKRNRKRTIASKKRLQIQKNLAQAVRQFTAEGGVPVSVAPAISSIGKMGKVTTFLNKAKGTFLEVNTATNKARAGLAQFGNQASKTGDTVQSAAGKVLLWTVATGAIFGTIRALKGAVGAFTEVEESTIALERVGRGFSEATDPIRRNEEIKIGARAVRDELLELSIAYGRAGQEAQEAAVIFARLGLSQAEVLKAVETALVAANVAGIGAAEASRLLAAAMSQFRLSAQDLPILLDRLNTLENTTRVRTQDLLASISRAGAVFREAGGSFEEFAAITAVVAERTGRSGAEIGNAFKTISARIGSLRIQKKIFDLTGVSIENMGGELTDIIPLLIEMQTKFKGLTEAQRAEGIQALAGIRRSNILQTTLDNLLRVQAALVRQYSESGSAQTENALIMETLAAKGRQLAAAFRQLGFTFARGALGDGLKHLVDGLTQTVRLVTALGPAILPLVAGFVAYGISVATAASTGTILGDTFAKIGEGVSKTNARIVRFVGSIKNLIANSGKLIAQNLRLASSNKALAASFRKGAVAAATQLKTSLAGLAAGMVRFAANPITVFLAGLAAITNALAAAKRTSDETFAAIKANQDNLTKGIQDRERRRDLGEATGALGKGVAARLEELYKKEVDGIQLTNAELREQIELRRALATSAVFDPKEASELLDEFTDSTRILKIVGDALERNKRAIEAEAEAEKRTILEKRQKLALEERLAHLYKIHTDLRKQLEVEEGKAIIIDTAEADKLQGSLDGVNREIRKLEQEITGAAPGWWSDVGDAINQLLNLNGTVEESVQIQQKWEQSAAATRKALHELGAESEETAKEVRASSEEVRQIIGYLDNFNANLSKTVKTMLQVPPFEEIFVDDPVQKATEEIVRTAKAIEEVQAKIDGLDKSRDVALKKLGKLDRETTERFTKNKEKANSELANLEKKQADNFRKRELERLRQAKDTEKKRGDNEIKQRITAENRITRFTVTSEKQRAVEAFNVLKATQARIKKIKQEQQKLGATDPEKRRGLALAAELKSRLNEEKQLKKNLENEISDLALQGALKRKEVERDITKEKQEQLKSIREALGAMSDAELISTTLFAGRVRRGEVGAGEISPFDVGETTRGFLAGFEKLTGFGGLRSIEKQLFPFATTGTRPAEAPIRLSREEAAQALNRIPEVLRDSIKNIEGADVQTMTASVQNVQITAQNVTTPEGAQVSARGPLGVSVNFAEGEGQFEKLTQLFSIEVHKVFEGVLDDALARVARPVTTNVASSKANVRTR